MRQLMIQVPRGEGDRVADAAARFEAVNVTRFDANRDGRPIETLIVDVGNSRVGPLLEALDPVEDVHVSFFPSGVLALRPPASEAPDQVTDVEMRSPIEVILAGLQSIGSWKGFLGYAAVAGVVVWVGLFTETMYLLTAAMLIAPFAGPAMNTAIGTAAGDPALLRRSVLRYVSSLAVTVAIAAALTWAVGQSIVPAMAESIANISGVTVLLPLAAGAAGGLHLLQSQRDSLVTGAGVGVLVAASLAPPAGVVGMAAAMGEWGLVGSVLFVLVLQLAGINLSATLVFRWGGLNTDMTRFDRGRRWLFPAGLVVTLVALAALLTWQYRTPIDLRRGSQAQHASAAIQDLLRDTPGVEPVLVSSTFTRTSADGEPVLLSRVYVRRHDEAVTQDEITRRIQATLGARLPAATPLVDVTMLEAPR